MFNSSAKYNENIKKKVNNFNMIKFWLSCEKFYFSPILDQKIQEIIFNEDCLPNILFEKELSSNKNSKRKINYKLMLKEFQGFEEINKSREDDYVTGTLFNEDIIISKKHNRGKSLLNCTSKQAISLYVQIINELQEELQTKFALAIQNSKQARIQSLETMKNYFREDIIEYLINCIINLEIRQLAESIISVVEKKEVKNGEKKYNTNLFGSQKVNYEYLLRFDFQSQIPNMIVTEHLLKKMNKFREDSIIFTPMDQNFPQIYDRYVSSGVRRKSMKDNKDKDNTSLELQKGRKQSSYSHKYSLKTLRKEMVKKEDTVKQLSDLMDPNSIGYLYDTKKYGLCHHCKQIKLLSLMKKCNYSSSAMGTAIPATKTLCGISIYNGILTQLMLIQ